MNILVCVKQVPNAEDSKINPQTKTIVREDVTCIVSPFDAYALELAVRLKEKHGGKVTALSMGPGKANAALRECLSVGADQAYHVSDPALIGSDSLATAYVLSTAIKKLEAEDQSFDLIFCGKQGTDWDNGQVGPALAEVLGCALVTYASEVEVIDDKARVNRENDDVKEIIETRLPAVVTVTKLAYEPRFPSIKSKLAANKAAIPILTAGELGVDLIRVGFTGSATKTVSTAIPSHEKNCVFIKEESNELSAQRLVSLMVEAKII